MYDNEVPDEDALFEIMDKFVESDNTSPRRDKRPHNRLMSGHSLDLDADDVECCTLPCHADGTTCSGPPCCPYLVLVDKEHTWTCTQTGLSFDQEMIDDGSGTFAPKRGESSEDVSKLPSTIRRRDPVNASMKAFMMAKNAERAPMSNSPSTTVSTVDSPSPKTPTSVGNERDRSKRTKRFVSNAYSHLAAEANNVLDEVVRLGEQTRCHRGNTPDISEQGSALRQRRAMLIACRRYIKQCQNRNEPPSFHEMHNLGPLVKHNEERCATKSTGVRKDGWYIKVRDAISRLSVSLWRLVLKTPYMLEKRRANDGFKQFVVGVAYRLKNGMRLNDGSELIPVCKRFCKALPHMRCPHDKGARKHPYRMSAHRGLCTFQRASNTVPEHTQHIFWADAISVAAALRRVHESESG